MSGGLSPRDSLEAALAPALNEDTMPTYEYKCNACSHQFEQFQSMKDKPLKKCPKCGKSALERLIGVGAAVIFKGSGFYQTDYRSEAYKKAAESDKPADTKSESKPADAAKAEIKPVEAKTESKPAAAEKPTASKNSAGASPAKGSKKQKKS